MLPADRFLWSAFDMLHGENISRRSLSGAILAVGSCVLAIAFGGCSYDGMRRVDDVEGKFDSAITDTPKPADISYAAKGDAATESAPKQRTAQIERAEKAARALAEDYGTSVAVSVMPLGEGEGFNINGDEQFVSASMIKLLVLACLMDRVCEGAVSLSQTYSLVSADCVGGTGWINSLPQGTVLSYDELAKAMIADSDNTATNVLIGVLGMDAINDEAERLGLSETSLQRLMMDLGGSAENYTSANDAASILHGFADGTIGDPDVCAKAIEYLKGQTDNDALAKGLPNGVEFAHKTGTLDAVRHDGGIVYADTPYILVVLTALGTSDANELMNAISERVYAAMAG